MPVNGERSLRPEAGEVRQLRSEMLLMRDKVERLINRLELTSFDATSATVANDNNAALPSNGWLLSNVSLLSLLFGLLPVNGRFMVGMCEWFLNFRSVSKITTVLFPNRLAFGFVKKHGFGS